MAFSHTNLSLDTLKNLSVPFPKLGTCSQTTINLIASNAKKGEFSSLLFLLTGLWNFHDNPNLSKRRSNS